MSKHVFFSTKDETKNPGIEGEDVYVAVLKGSVGSVKSAAKERYMYLLIGGTKHFDISTVYYTWCSAVHFRK